MFAKEKLVIRFHLLIRNLSYHFVFWLSSLLFYVFLTGDQQLFAHYLEFIPLQSWYVTSFLLSAILAVLFSWIDSFFNDRYMRLSAFRFIAILPPILYFLLGLSLLILASISPKELLGIRSLDDFIALLPKPELPLIRFLVYFYLGCFFNNLLMRISKKVGKGNFMNWMLGRMNQPREAERIFMFIDMKSSTRLAEQLSHEKFSHLVQDVFNDMAIVDNYNGEIYQYVGDGAIISWPVDKGFKENNFLKAYFGFIHLIERRERYYQRRYGITPQFKAGIHVGNVMVLQVGRIRRDISYNGDTLNTAARIESNCNEYRKNLLVSGDVVERMEENKDYLVKEVGNLRLKGKRRMVDIYHIREKRSIKPRQPKYTRDLWEKVTVVKDDVTLDEKS